MVAFAPVPSNESARLEVLHSYQVLDTPPDERFDLFTRLCTWLFDAPVAAINLIDAERTFFKSLIGLQPYAPLRCTSVCAHAVGGFDPIMVVEDLSKDDRFHDHALVGRGLRFYAGALLHSASGHVLGTLCIADRRPRSFSAEERRKLVELAAGVGAVLELHRSSILLLQAASQDTLTGLCNRRLFNEILDHAVAQARHGEPCAILFLDLDHFKRINDQFGHAGGDALLREVGRRLTQTVGREDVVARLGGDEFVVLVRGLSAKSDAEKLAPDILAAFSAPFEIDEEKVAIRGSIGVALCPHDARDVAGLLAFADRALYQAKQSGRGRWKAYAEENRETDLGCVEAAHAEPRPLPFARLAVRQRTGRATN